MKILSLFDGMSCGMGWELFSQYVRALHESKPKYFLYENNKSMSKDIHKSICDTFGFEPILINSSLVSAQNRNRLYWVGIKQEDGTYQKADIKQPDDKGIVLKDILETGSLLNPLKSDENKSHTLTASYYKAGNEPSAYNSDKARPRVVEPVGTTKDGKSYAVTAYYSTGQNPKHTLEKHIGTLAAELVSDGDDEHAKLKDLKYCNDKNMQHLMRGYGSGGKITSDTTDKSPTLLAAMGTGGGNGIYTAVDTEDVIMKVHEATKKGYVEVEPGNCVDLAYDNPRSQRRGRDCKDKTTCLTTSFAVHQYLGTKDQPMYPVKDGQIEIKGKKYPIKLRDGKYLIRKLTVRECSRLQTVPEWFEFPVSKTQAYKQLGNGWTVAVIQHLISSVYANN